MFPTLFDSSWIGLTGEFHFTVSTYMVAILLGFLGAAILAWRDAKEMGIERQTFVDFAIWMLIVGVLGARVMHVIADGFFWDYVHLIIDPLALEGRALSDAGACVSNAQCLAEQGRGLDIGAVCNVADGLCYPQRDPFRWLKFWAGGLTIYGSLIGTVAVGWYFIRKNGWDAGKILDLGGYGIPLGLFAGRLGCFAAGCCFGATCDIEFLGVRFPQGSLAYQHHFEAHYELLNEQWHAGIKQSLAVWPTQLISAGYALAIFLVAYFWVRPAKRFDGQVFLTTAVLYGVSRFMLEFIRADQRGEVLGLSTSQFVSIPVVLLAAWILWSKWRAAQ
jgi:phosphatidylglycerol---prolipoprotein diacylglyceryl transferase